MPILDPSLQLFCVNKAPKKNSNKTIHFFLKYLHYAAKNYNQNFTTVEASIQFKNDLAKCSLFINKGLGIPFNKTSLDNLIIPNYFQYLINLINTHKLYETANFNFLEGEYFICSNIFSTRLFQPNIFHSECYQWFFSDSPIAILAINSNNFNNKLVFQQMKLEIDLMQAVGFVLVLCTNFSLKINNFIFFLIEDNQFSEIHININGDSNMKYFLLEKDQLNFYSLNSYFYIYTYFEQLDSQSKQIYKELKQLPNVKVIHFVKNINDSIKIIDSNEVYPFPYCQIGFKYDLLRIFMSNIPLYDTEDEHTSITPFKVSSITQGFILKDDFLNWKKERIKIFFEDRTKNNHNYEKYIDFDDIHLIREQFYLNNTFDMVKIDESSLKYIDEIYYNVKRIANEKEYKKFNYFNKLFKKKSIKNVIEHVIYLYISSNLIIPRKSQIYTIFEACQSILDNKYCGFNKYNKKQKNKGAVYQVETGEGKTCIIAIIAAMLALNGKTVHIASSNIKLSIRDYSESFNFFKLLNFKSAVLLHKYELPKKRKQKENFDKEMDADKAYLKYFEQKEEIESFEEFSYENTKFYRSEVFDNSSRMNFCVCGINNDNTLNNEKVNIIFSTFVNFECFYLKLVERCPAYIEKYFSNCVLLIDEADSILIDEITNGTIISREIKTNSKDILTFVYHQGMKNLPAEDTLKEIKNKYPECLDLKVSDIENMYSEIKLIQTPQFKNGKKYTIDDVFVKNKNLKKNKLFKKVLKSTKKIALKVCKGLIKYKNDDDNDDSDDEDEEYNEEEEEEEYNDEETVFHEIVPFDYDHKGISEPSKEFSGFIQQFIAIHENETNNIENMIVKEMSMSYLYISHPIFVNLYNNVCGFTGTVGKENDKNIYEEQYGLIAKKVPRNKPKLMINFPMILCDKLEERNDLIVKEILEYHSRKNPVLAIFQDITEIKQVELKLYSKGIHFINIFDGKKDFLKPDNVSGINGAVSLGSNFCGRGTNIKSNNEPLHVIISFYTSNTRVMDQAHGRTARQGKNGTSRIICLRSEFLKKIQTLDYKKTNKIVNNFLIKSKKQIEFIMHFKSNRCWIFSPNIIEKQEISNSDIITLRNARINVNRIVAFNYKFPIKMKVKTFLKIQTQKIFSIINCPNSVYTWRLFQRYIREMILQSWSIMIDKFEKKSINDIDYKKEFETKINKLYVKLDKYLPNNKDFEIISTFIHICKLVVKENEQKVLDSFNSMPDAFWEYNKHGFFSVQFGFKPFSLLTESGARVTYRNLKKMNYIKDPELKYEQQEPKSKRITLLSITKKIDEVFNKICQTINKALGEKTFLKFFLRRMICGCEFGVCLDFKYENTGLADPTLIIDKDPLLLFTLSVKSVIPILAGVLIITLVYLASMAKKIGEWFTCFPKKLTQEVVLRSVSVVVNVVAPELAGILLDKVILFLKNALKKQLRILKDFNSKTSKKAVDIIQSVVTIFKSSLGNDLVKTVTNKLTDCIKITFNWQKLIKKCLDPVRLMKISFLILLNLAVFIMNFNLRKNAIKQYQSDAEKYDNNPTKKELDELVNKNKYKSNLDGEIVNDDDMKKKIEDSYKKVSKTYLFKYSQFNPLDKLVKLTDFYEKNKEIIKDGYSMVRNVILKSNGKKCERIKYSGFRKLFLQQVVFYATNQFPSILQLIGHSCRKRKQYLFVESKEQGTLEQLIERLQKNQKIRIDDTNKLIISYGIACAIEHLHKNKIIHRNLKPSNIYLDSNFYPYVSDFFLAKQAEIEMPYELNETTIEFMAPEFINDYKTHQNSFKLDVYSFGIIIFILMIENCSFDLENKTENLKQDILNGKRPKIPNTIDQKWKQLIIDCWNQDPEKRPDFSTICNRLESSEFVNNNIDIKAFNSYRKIINRK